MNGVDFAGKRAVIYARVSTDEQTKGQSLDVQIAFCKKWCASKGVEVAKVFNEGDPGDSLYIIGVEYKAPTYEPVNSYALYNTATRQFVGNGFITDGTGSAITLPYAVAVNPATREIFVADAKDYKTPGELRCYSQKGALKWKATTGVIPGHIAFSDKRLKGLK